MLKSTSNKNIRINGVFIIHKIINYLLFDQYHELGILSLFPWVFTGSKLSLHSNKNNSHLDLTSNTYSHIKELLLEAGLKATHPRIAVLHELMRQDDHPGAENIHEGIRENNPSISLGSVYRILEKFVEANLAVRVATKDGTKRYDANLEPHSHIYSVNTEEIQDYYDPELNDLIKKYFEQKRIENFTISEIKLQINGEKKDPKGKVTIV